MLIGHKIHHISQTDSTMSYCKNLAKSGATHGTVVSADFQTGGRGRFQRKWISSSSQNLLLSILLKPDIHQINYLNMAASLSIYDVAVWATKCNPAIKWPNDVEVLGKKIAGILVESEITNRNTSYAIIGIGLNVNLQPKLHGEIADKATSLVELCQRYVSRPQTLRVLMHHLNYYYDLVKNDISLLEMWKAKLNTLGKLISLSTQSGIVSGIAESINEDGTINIRLDNNTIFTGSSGEVTRQRHF